MNKSNYMFIVIALAAVWSVAGEPVRFNRLVLSDAFHSEGASIGDFNKDGKLDVVSGPFWYEGPDFSKSHTIYPPKRLRPQTEWSSAFLIFVDDLNRDGWDDVIVINEPGEDASWFENPRNSKGMWKRHLMLRPVDNESPTYTSILNNGRRQLVCIQNQQFGYAVPHADDPTQPWAFHPITPKRKAFKKYTHGLGVGDINGDGRPDLLEKDGWWEQPASLTPGAHWKEHRYSFAEAAAQMYVYDVNGDGRNDVITALHAHGYGLAWHEQTLQDGQISFVRHDILDDKPNSASGKPVFSQLHAVELADVNADGLLDIITGKRHWAHGPKGDPDPNGPSVLYWFELKRGKENSVQFIAHQIDDQSGVGTQVLAADVTGDRKLDIIVGNKNGTFVLAQTEKPAPPAPAPAKVVDHFKEYIRSTPPRSPEDQRKGFHLPEGFEIRLVAAEPQINKPLNMAFDNKGRLWVTSTKSYPMAKAPGTEGKDSVKVIELDRNGRAARVTTFADKLDLPIGLYPASPSPLIHDIPSIKRYYDDNNDGQADRSEVLYSRFGYEVDTHGMINAFRRGFDGWLYANQGFGNTSVVSGSDGQTITMKSGNTFRMRMDGSHVEVFKYGQTNPYGLTWDAWGNLYSSDSHSKPFYQLLRGAYYESLEPQEDGLGFAPAMMKHGHNSTALAGACCYAADQFPEEFRGNLFVGNVMTSRINRDSVTFAGSSPQAKEEPDFVVSDDPWFRPVDIQLGPDGALYVADFYNRIIGHHEVPLDHPGRDKLRGRIWRISYTASDRGFEPFDLSVRTIDELIDLLAHSNLTLRKLATDEIADRIGLPAAAPLKRMLQRTDTTSEQRAHALWALHRIGMLDDSILASACSDGAELVRVHSMRMLADRAEWTSTHRELALKGLTDSDALVRRCAADALGAHPNVMNVRPMLDLLNATPRADTHLIHVVRMAIRDSLKPDKALERLPELSREELATIADLVISIPTPAAADFLLANLEKLPSEQKQLAAYTRHAIRYAARERVDTLLEVFRDKLRDNPGEQFAILDALARGATERSEPISPAARAWAMELATWALTPVDLFKDTDWTFVPLKKEPSKNPWTLQSIPSKDKQSASFFHSLPYGERLTGILRSKPFIIPSELSFFVAGQDGRPRTNPAPRNFVRLRSASDNSILAEVHTPRNDTAQPVKWDLSAHAGQRGYLELVDGNDDQDYAWLAAGRFQPDVVPIPNGPDVAGQDERVAALKLTGLLRLEDLRPAVRERLHDPGADTPERAAAAAALVALNPEGAIDDLLKVATATSENTALRIAAVEALPAVRAEAHTAALISCFARASWRLQKTVAMALAKTPEGAEALFAAAAQDKAPKAMLQNFDVRLQLLMLNLPDTADRITALTRGLPSITEEVNRQSRQRVVAFQRSPGDPARGLKVFAATCAVCHTKDGQGTLVGPQLDGIASRGVERLIEDILEPNRNVDPAFRYSNVYLKDGRIISALKRREEGDTVIYADTTGKEIAVSRESIVKSVPSTLSLMPAGLAESLSAREFNDLLAYLLKPQ